jgi:hypothetical protein
MESTKSCATPKVLMTKIAKAGDCLKVIYRFSVTSQPNLQKMFFVEIARLILTFALK